MSQLSTLPFEMRNARAALRRNWHAYRTEELPGMRDYYRRGVTHAIEDIRTVAHCRGIPGYRAPWWLPIVRAA